MENNQADIKTKYGGAEQITESAKYNAKSFKLATGVNSFVIEKNDDECNCDRLCGHGFCSALQKITGAEFHCIKHHLNAAEQAERFGGKYIYYCPAGFVHFISPLIYLGDIVGAIGGGPVLLTEHDDFFYVDILKKYNISGEYHNALIKELKTVQYMQPERVSGLSEMIFVTASHINQSLKLLQTRDMLLQQSEISDKIQRIKEQDNQDFYPIETERLLMKKIAMGDKRGARELLNDLLGHIFFSSGKNFEILKARVLELLVLLSRGAMEGGADTDVIFGMNYRFLNEINGIKDVENMTYWLSQIMVRFAEQVFDFHSLKHAEAISKAVEYIKRNFQSKLTLKQTADYVSFSPSYFSKIFCEEMKCSFSQYLNKVRIENAKILLQGGNLSLADIALMCGFEDQSYFTKIFKSVTGVSPKNFKYSKDK